MDFNVGRWEKTVCKLLPESQAIIAAFVIHLLEAENRVEDLARGIILFDVVEAAADMTTIESQVREHLGWFVNRSRIQFVIRENLISVKLDNDKQLNLKTLLNYYEHTTD